MTKGRALVEFLGVESEIPERTGLASVLVCAYRSISAETCESLINLLARGNWRYSIRHGDAWIGRARSVVASQWYRQTNDEVFVMIDADITFTADQIDRLVRQCRPGFEIVTADYPVHNGENLAGVVLAGGRQMGTLVELEYAPAGCTAVHRSVVRALVQAMPLCHASLPIAYWPLFMNPATTVSAKGDVAPLSEDYSFTKLARDAGLRAWRDTSVKVAHLSEFPLTVDNMRAMFKAGGLSW